MQDTNPLLIAGVAAAFALGLVGSAPAAYAKRVEAPAVPANLEVESGNAPFLVGHAVGTQNYVCLPSGAGFAYKLFTPEATLFNKQARQIITHFFSPNPEENGVIRATWQDSVDTSTFWGEVKPGDSASHLTDPGFVAEGAIAWLKVTRAGTQDGPGGGDALSDTTFVQRVNTVGGVEPADCTALANVGKVAFVPYEADYVFYSNDELDD